MKGLKPTDTSFLLEAGLEKLHQESLNWASDVELWKKEVKFFQKLLDAYSPKMDKETKKRLDHFQNLIIYYGGELLDQFAKKVRQHEKFLSRQFAEDTHLDEVEYRHAHTVLRGEIDAFKKQFQSYKHDLFDFIRPLL